MIAASAAASRTAPPPASVLRKFRSGLSTSDASAVRPMPTRLPGSPRAQGNSAGMRQSEGMGLPHRTTAEPVALIGAGSVGCMLAAHLANAGHDIVVCGRTPLERIEMTIDGETVENKIAWAADAGEPGDVRFAVLATKIHHTPDAAGWLAAVPAGGLVIAAQNGVDHRTRVTPLTPADVAPMLV